MKTKIRQIGNSLGLTLPSELLKNCALNLGDEVNLSIIDGKVVIEKLFIKPPVIPSKPVTEMSYDELKSELTSGYELTMLIIQSGKHELIPDSVARSNEVLEEFNQRMYLQKD